MSQQFGYNYITEEQREESQTLKDQISYNGGSSKAPQDNSGSSTKGAADFDFGGESNVDNTEADQAKEDGKEVIAHDKNTSSVVDKATEEEKQQVNNENGSTESETSWKDQLLNADKAEPEKVENNKVENNKVEDNKVEDNKVEDNKVEDNKVEDNKVEDNKVEDNKVEDNKVEDNKAEDNKAEDNKVEDNKVETLSVKAVDGYATYVNSSIQFKITGGDNIKIEGLEGIDHSFVNGVLTVNTPSEAGVIPVCISNSNGNSMTFSITVNGIIG